MSGPASARTRPRTTPRANVTLGAQALAVVRSLPEHSLIDRLVRGRAWIPVLGILLAGIVAMQVEVLKLGTDMGRWMARSSTLQSQNELLQANVASLADEQRIERMAAGMGMVMPAATGVAFLSVQPGGNAGQAIANIHTPDPAGFAAQLSAQLAAAAAATGAAASPTTTSSTSAPQTAVSTTAPSSASGGPAAPAPVPAAGAAAIAPAGAGQTSSPGGR